MPVLWVLSGLVAGPISAAPVWPMVSIPGTDQSLHVTLPLPSTLHLDAQKRWELIAVPDGKEPVAADIIPGRAPDGRAAESQQALVFRLNESAANNGMARQYQLRAAKLPSSAAATAFRWEDLGDTALGVWEGKRPVFVYNHGVQSKEDVPADRNRSTYLHPIYGLDGEVLTDDFPKDHYHHRGLFWAWPHVRIDGINYDLWDIRGIHQRFERWLERRAGAAAAVLGVENGWFVANRKVMQERVWLTVFPATDQGRVLDVDLTWIPIDRPITLAGAEEKSYGGLTLRFAPRTGTVITTPLGSNPDDLAMTRLAWADLSAQFVGAPNRSGASIFIGPDHPDYPPTWLTRHYGALCVGWPGVNPATFQPGDRIHCRYRVWIHRNTPDKGELARTYGAFEALGAVRWTDPPP